MKYITTKKQCQEQINKYNNVCCGCGGKLTPIETVDNANNPTFWVGCLKCSCFDNGVSSETQKIARKMVIEKCFRYFREQEPENKESMKYDYWLKSQTRGTCGVVIDILNYNSEMK